MEPWYAALLDRSIKCSCNGLPSGLFDIHFTDGENEFSVGKTKTNK
jgi:hypothetical protein